MVSRASQLGMLNEEEAKRLWINLGRRGWRQREPLDDLPCEKPRLLAKVADALIRNKIKDTISSLTWQFHSLILWSFLAMNQSFSVKKMTNQG